MKFVRRGNTRRRRYRLRRGPAIILGILGVVGLGTWFYMSQQPKLVMNETKIVEYGATDEAALSTLMNEDASRFDSVEAVLLDTKQVSTEEEPTREGKIKGVFKGNTKEVTFSYSVKDTQAPIISLSKTEVDYSDVSPEEFLDVIQKAHAVDPVDGELAVTFSFDDMKESKNYTKEELQAIVAKLRFKLNHAITVHAIDAHGNQTTQALSVRISDGSMSAIADQSEEVKEDLIQQFTAEYAAVYDVTNQTVLFDKGYTAQIYPASMTKMMTVYAALTLIDAGVAPDWNKNVPVTLDTVYTVPPAIDWVHGIDASNAGIWGGDTLTIRDLLYGVMLPSGADASYALSFALTGSQEGLVDTMNRVAGQIGMTQSNFTNVTGLHEANHYTTIRDLMILMNTAWPNDAYKKIMSTGLYVTDSTYNKGETAVYESHSLGMLRMMGNTSVLASKSGYTDESMRSLASIVMKDDKLYFVVVNRSQEDGTGLSAITDTINLINNTIQ